MLTRLRRELDSEPAVAGPGLGEVANRHPSSFKLSELSCACLATSRNFDDPLLAAIMVEEGSPESDSCRQAVLLLPGTLAEEGELDVVLGGSLPGSPLG